MIISFILITSLFVLGVIQMGENSYQSLLGVKGLNIQVQTWAKVEITLIFIYLLLTDHHKVLILSHNILRL